MNFTQRLSSRAAWLPLGGALAVATVLLVTSLYIRQTITRASHLVARGVGIDIAARGREALRDGSWPASAELLAAFLDAHRDSGLRGVRMMDAAGRTVAQAGTFTGPLPTRGDIDFQGQRARLLLRLGRPPRHGRGPPGALLPGEPGPISVAYEFEPAPALELQTQAERLLLVAVVSALGIVALALALSRSMGQREAMQAELERGRRLAALGEMSAVLAHELRNPLASLKGHAQLLEEDLAEDPRRLPKVTRLVGEALRLEKLMTDLLAFVANGELRAAPVDPNDVLRAAARGLDPALLALRFLEPSVTLVADADRLEQAVENVLRNAVQASPPDRRVEAHLEVDGGELTFVVRDHGAGIKAGEEQRIFEPFVTGKLRGVGLGLPITRRIMELHGGQVTACHPSGGGAEFRLTLPLRKG